MVRGGLLLILALAAGGCADLAYYAQAVGGHSSLLQAARPIESLLADPATGTELRRQLEEASAIRDFASRELALPDNGSYRSYADLGRPYVVWNVFAAPELSLRAESWCVPVAGCVNYRGYYRRAAAEALAGQLRDRGMDTYVAGVPAYSTLGFYHDPVLNTFLGFGEAEVARLIFHELAHQRVHVAGDSEFNESFAVTVENEGVRRWLGRRGDRQSEEAFAARQARKADFLRLVAEFRRRLEAVYAAGEPPSAKRAAKAAVLADLQEAYLQRKASWGGQGGYDSWFAEGLNNAKLVSVSLYTRLVPAFERLLAEEGGDLPRFYRRVERLSRLPDGERKGALDALLAEPVTARR